MLPNVCSSKFAPLLCRKYCKLCNSSSTTEAPTDTSTYPPWTETCMDHVVGALTCPVIPNVCDDDYGRLFCRKSCAVCGPTTTTTTTTVPTTPIADTCTDEVGHGLECAMLPNVCSSKFAPLLCRKYCKLCNSSSTTEAPTDTSTYPPWTETCMDHVVGALTCPVIPSVCDDDYGRLFCRKSCAVCGPTTTTTTTTVPTTPIADTCTDEVGYGLECAMLPNVCSSKFAPLLCRKYCKLCNSSSTTEAPTDTSTYPPWTETCMDHVVGALTCPVIPNVCDDDYGRLFCRKSCAVCGPTTTTTTTTVPTTPIADTCTDEVGHGLECAMLPNVCSSKFAPLLCRKYCKLCNSSSTTEAPTDTSTYPPWTETCMDHVVGALTCPVIPNVCDDDYGRLFCRKSCAVCGPTTTTTTTTVPPSTTVADAENTTTTTTSSSAPPSFSPTQPPSSAGTSSAASPSASSSSTTTSTPPSFPATTTTPPSTSTPALHWPKCKDHVGNGRTCASYPSICRQDPALADLLCPKFCGFCVPLMETGTYAPDTTTDSNAAGGCVDRVVNGLTCVDIPSVCASHQYGRQVCPRTCNACGEVVATTTPSITPATTLSPPSTLASSTLMMTTPAERCEDNVGLGLTCDGLPGACNDPLASIICKKTCGFCDCEDRIVGMTCQDLVDKYDKDPCRDELGHQVCARFCGFC
ncbi:uncharacterized protein LOC143300722 [Babylonia areolata]|uniref:uncharacterized protein LOC143300722 n=1 Tax=Babylonia areolata TaxID=304850 RepID=UPI003FD315A6